jgi:hypothetical protein
LLTISIVLLFLALCPTAGQWCSEDKYLLPHNIQGVVNGVLKLSAKLTASFPALGEVKESMLGLDRDNVNVQSISLPPVSSVTDKFKPGHILLPKNWSNQWANDRCTMVATANQHSEPFVEPQISQSLDMSHPERHLVETFQVS